MDTLNKQGGTHPQEPAAAGGDSSDEGSRASANEQFSTTQIASPPRVQNGGGPKTTRGRNQSRRNSLKHGLTAKKFLLEDESPAEFDAFWQGFRDYHRPVGIPEEVLVEELARSKWCSRRDQAAERAEIELEKRYNSRAADRLERAREEATIIEASVDAQAAVDTQTARDIKAYVEIPRPGLMARWDNPVIRQKCLELLKSLLKSVQQRYFYPVRDNQIIDKLFGVRTPSEFRLLYSLWADREPLTAKYEEFKEFDLPPAERLAEFINYLQEQISTYERLAKKIDDCSAKREKLERESAVVPEAPRLDRLLRYRASHERDFDRALNQLERLQRTRKGQPVPPTLNVNLST